MCSTPNSARASTIGINDDAERRRGAALPRRPHSERMRGRRHLADLGGVERQDVGARHGIVHERAGERLSGAGVVEALLQQRLTDALRDAAVGLAVDDQRVHGAADVVDGGVPDDRQRPELGLDLDLADMAAVGKAGDARRSRRTLPVSGPRSSGGQIRALRPSRPRPRQSVIEPPPPARRIGPSPKVDRRRVSPAAAARRRACPSR